MLLCPWDFPGKNTGVGCQFPLQGIFQTLGSNARLLHRRWILDHWATGEDHSISTLAQPFNHPLHAHHSWHDSRNEANEARGCVRCSDCSLHCELKLHLPGWRVAANCQKCRNQSHVSETDLFSLNTGTTLAVRLLRCEFMCPSFQAALSSVQFSLSVVSNTLQLHGPQHTRPPCPSPTSGVYSNSCPSSWWCHPTISSSVGPFSSCPQSFSASGSFPMSQFFASGGQRIGVSA